MKPVMESTKTRTTADSLHRPPMVVGSGETPTLEVPAAAWLVAVPLWLAFTWLACQIVAPLALLTVAPDGARLLATGIVGAPAFALTAFVTTVWAAARRPKIRLASGWEPATAAAAGWGLAFVVLHQTSAFFVPITQMPLGTLAGFVLINLVEAGLVAAVLSTIASSRRSAFALGAGFQAMYLTLTAAILAVL